MRASRARVISYAEQASDDEQEAWQPSNTARDDRAGGPAPQQAAADRSQRAAARPPAPAAAAGRGGAAGAVAAAAAGPSQAYQLEEWEEAELALLSPESQKRERRRLANRDCARRIRQRQTELLTELAASVEALQGDNNRLLASLKEVTQWWRDITIENCELRSQIALLQAGGGAGANGASDGSDGSHSTGSGAGRSDMGSPIAGGLGGGWDQQLLSPGWPSPMLM